MYNEYKAFKNYEYKGSFLDGEYCGWNKNSIRITRISIAAEELYFPDYYNGCPVTSIWGYPHRSDYQDKKVFPQVRQIYIPSPVEEVGFPNNLFPNLEKVIISEQNTFLTTDGKMIFKNSGKNLCLCPVNGTGELVLPDKLQRLEAYSLACTGYEEIRFPNKASLTVHEDALWESRWLNRQTGSVVIGDLLFYCQPDEQGNLYIPDRVRRFRKGALSEWVKEKQGWNYRLASIQCRTLPPAAFLTELEHYTSGTKLVITSGKTKLNRSSLRRLGDISGIKVPPDQKWYRTEDGVLFSKDGKSLIYYPPGRKQSSYQIPDGIVQIDVMAFAFQSWLEEVIMPDTVRKIGNAAFLRCTKLKKVHFSDNIKELPDSNVYMKGGVFEECVNLEELILPEHLKYLGSRCFYKSGLKKVTLNAELEMIGDYAFYNDCIHSIRLPASIRRMGKGSLFNIPDVWAYAGTARGLLGAVNACYPGEKESLVNMSWIAFRIHVMYRRKDGEYLLRIPGSIKREEVYHLSQAWDHDGDIDMDEYDNCFEFVGDAGERLQMATDGLKRVKNNPESVYYSYMKKVSSRIAQKLLSEHREEDFRILLRAGFISEASLKKLLKLANDEGLTASSAYIMERIKKTGRKQRRYQL